MKKPARKKRYPANSKGRGMICNPTFNGTKGEAHNTQHITARKVVEVNNFLIPKSATADKCTK